MKRLLVPGLSVLGLLALLAACETSSGAGASAPPAAAPVVEKTAPPPAAPVLLAVGAAAPDFTLPDQEGRSVNLADLKGKRALIWFYPKADTGG